VVRSYKETTSPFELLIAKGIADKYQGNWIIAIPTIEVALAYIAIRKINYKYFYSSKNYMDWER